MGIDLSYRCGEALFETRVTESDWNTIEALRAHLPGEMVTIYGARDLELGEEVTISAAALRTGLERLGEFLKAHPDVLPKTYQSRSERFSPPGVFSTGGMSGIRLADDPDYVYSLWTGFDECRLERQPLGVGRGDGMGWIRDIRGRTELQTANVGIISIRARPTKSGIRRTTKQVLQFLAEIGDGEVVRCVS